MIISICSIVLETLYLSSLPVASAQTYSHNRKVCDQLRQYHSRRPSEYKKTGENASPWIEIHFAGYPRKDNRAQSRKRHGPVDEHTDPLEPNGFEQPRLFQETQSVLKGGETETFCVFSYYNPYISMQRVNAYH